MEYNITKLPNNSLFARFYFKKNQINYDGTILTVPRGNGEYEIIGWMTPKDYGKHKDYMIENIHLLDKELSKLCDDYKYLTASFRKDKFNFFQRMFKKYYKLEHIKDFDAEYNSVKQTFVYVKIVPS
jgi:hypothetical protein